MGVSIRAYARHRGVSHVAVLQATKEGRIALEPDGTVDPAKADAAWDAATDPAQARATSTFSNGADQQKPGSLPVRPIILRSARE